MPPVLLLAGGRATRLGGGDKPLLDLGCGTVLEVLLRRLRPQAGPLAIGANGDPRRFDRFGLPVLPDAAPDCGPLAGVLAGLGWAASLGAATLVTVPGDTPFVPADLVARLGAGPAYAQSASGAHPLVAAWPVTARAALERFLDSGFRRARDFAAALESAPVLFSQQPDPFLNINTADDLARARRFCATAPRP